MPRLSAAASASSCARGSELRICGAMSAKFQVAVAGISLRSRRGAFCARILEVIFLRMVNKIWFTAQYDFTSDSFTQGGGKRILVEDGTVSVFQNVYPSPSVERDPTVLYGNA
ncbi:hypothetical protein STEG23_027428 [Scotinomys teguina]